MNELRVINIEKGNDSTEQKVPFQKVTFEVIEYSRSGAVMVSPEKPRTAMLWGKRIWNNGTEDVTIAAHPLFGRLAVGSIVPGEVVTLETQPYQPEGFKKEQTRITLVVFKGESAVGRALQQLRQYGAGVYEPVSHELIPALPERVQVG